jgi:AraC family transcriptional regulator, glycine betaine-responsive activator
MCAGTENAEASRPASGDRASSAVRLVGIVLSEGFSLPGAGIVAEAFQLANELSRPVRGDRVRYRVRLLSRRGGVVTCSSSVQVWTDELDVRAQHTFDVLFIGHGGDDCGERAVPVPCAGTAPTTQVFDLPAAQADDRFEAVRSALTVVVHDLGPDVAREIAERLMPGSGAKLMPPLGNVGATVADKVRRSAQWLRENCDRPISVADAAQEAAMSERNFLRRFKLEMGITPSEYLLRTRLDMTCRLLADTELPVDKIARRSGMGNGDHLAKIFRKRWSISPTEYRSRVRRERDASTVAAPSAASGVETRDFVL